MSQTSHNGESQPFTTQFYDRPRLDSLLKDALKKPLTSVIAGAGYGKTYAVSSSLEAMHCKYAWLQLSELDNVVSILWRRLFYALEVHDAELAKRLYFLGYPDSPASFHQFLRLISVDLQHKERFVLVLDDFHTIQEEAVLSFFEKLINASIPNLSIVLISREKPHLALAGILSKGLMARVTEDDLRFTQDEMDAYFKLQGETLDDDMVSSLYAYTEGWILAIYLVGLSLKRGGIYSQNPISQAKIDIFSLIEEQVFHAASIELQRFMIAITLLDIVPAGLLKEWVEDTPEILAEMTDSSLLISYDPHTDCYRLHPLFKEFLTEKRAELTVEEITKTRLTAAAWYQRHDQPEDAINHYRVCGCYPEIFDIIMSINNRVAKDLAGLFITLIEQAPDETIKARPIMRVVKAKYLFSNNRIQEAQHELTVIREEFEALPSTQGNLAILGEVYVLLAIISIVKQNLEFVTLFKKADECLPGGSVLVDYRFDIAEGFNVIGIKNPIPGELMRYQDALFEAAPYSARVMNGCSYGMEYLNAADAAFMIGDIRNAEKYAYETVYRAQQQQQYGIEYMANFYLIRIFVYKGDYTKIALLLGQMKEQMERLQNTDCMTIYDIIKGWFFVKIGKPTKVAKWILYEEETRKMLPPVVLGREYLVRSDSLLAEGRDYELLGFMKQSDVFYEERGVLYARIQNKITESIIHHYLGNQQESIDALQKAYELSHANNLIMQYIEYGSKMRAVIRAAIKEKDCKIPVAWLENILTKSSTYAKRLTQVEKEYNTECGEDKRDQINLSKREGEVLSSICQGLTRNEIADTYNLSANTVNSILQNIFSKLGAINSLDAVRIAMMMDLV